MMIIVIKVGTQSILSKEGMPLIDIMQSIVNQIVDIQQQGHKVIFISSGAVSFGRNIARNYLNKEYNSSIGEKQLLASLGQHELIHLYSKMLIKHKFLASQILLTKQDFYTRQHYLNISRLIRETLKHNYIIPIINENDSVAIEELMFTDNDELAGLIATQINADKLIILSNIEGVYSGNPDLPESTLLHTINLNQNWPNVSSSKSLHGRGGMISKLSNAKKMSKLGIMTHIASINQPNILNRIINGESVGTTIVPYHKKSNIKKWIAYSSPTGKIFINDPLYEILKEDKRIISILPVGILSYNGKFEKGDIIEILNINQDIIGLGIARYDSNKLDSFLGQKNKPALIHYDYLYIF
ncbi:Glutamate 5-kinase [Rickettsiales bacterium Ac37b]|nr:Glutamate 5-kinase [Rickettsiales bacterium Ac37b]